METGKSSADTTHSESILLHEMSWQGPLPPPAALRAINELVPNGAERLIKQLELETAHRHKLETRQQTFPLIDHLAARLVALLFAAGCLTAIVICVQSGAQIPATVMGGAMIVAGINAFMSRSSSVPPKNEASARSKRK